MAVVVHLSRTEETYVQQLPEVPEETYVQQLTEVPVDISDEIQVADATIESPELNSDLEIAQIEVDIVSTENSSEITGI
jgi:hypothetical protein